MKPLKAGALGHTEAQMRVGRVNSLKAAQSKPFGRYWDSYSDARPPEPLGDFGTATLERAKEKQQ